MNKLIIKNLKNKHTLILCKISGQKMGYIPYDTINSLKRGITSVSELSFTVNKYYDADNKINPLYDELKNERFILLDEEECFIIKNIVKRGKNKKEITAYSKEKKLFKNIIEIEDITLTLKTPYEEIEDCYSLDELLYEATGWHIGYVSDIVLYNPLNETELDILNKNEVELSTEEKLRYQESISTNWYDFIMEDISEQFECYPIFDSYNKLINLYSESELGENLNLLLSYDNYLKEIEEETNTEDITTRLILKGNDDLTIIESNPTGEAFVEDYSYFIENKEMTDELIIALQTYEIMVEERSKTWHTLKEDKIKKNEELQMVKNQLKIVYSKIEALKMIISSSTDEEFKAQKQNDLVKLYDNKVILEQQGEELQNYIDNLVESINNINMLCKKEYATDKNGQLIFNSELLDELKEFIYQDTYNNDSIMDSITLFKIGKNKIKEMCKPLKTWSIDSINFMSRIIDNEFRQQWEGVLSLGDLIILKDDDNKIIPVYFVGYTQGFKNGSETLQLELSNKKASNEFSLTIGKKLTMAKESYRIVKSNQSSINKIRKNRLGLNYDKINKLIK